MMVKLREDALTTVLALFAAVATICFDVVAATQGTLGTTSTATSVISITVPPNFKLSGFSDFSLGKYSGSGTMTANEDLCVYSNGTGSYHVVITDDSTLSPSGFSVQNSNATVDIPYTVKWNNTTGTSGNASAAYGGSHAGSGANVTSPTCSTGGLTSNLQVNFTQANLRAATGGLYSTNITAMVEP